MKKRKNAAIPTDTPLRRGHIAALDGIRGIAILLVLMCHLFFAGRTGVTVVDVFYRAATAGWVGVDLFFVLSGFLITGILIQARDDSCSARTYFQNFYARRALRIFPLYYAVLLIGLLLSLTLGRGDAGNPTGFWKMQGWLWTFTANLPMARGNCFLLFQAWHLTFLPFWSLAIEEQFYLFWPLVVWLCPPRKLLTICLGLAALSATCRTAYVQHTGRTLTAFVFTPIRLDGLLLGASCAIVVRSPTLVVKVRRIVPATLVVWVVAVVEIFYFTDWEQRNRFVAGVGYSILSVGFSAVILGCVEPTTGATKWIAERRLLRLLGKYSFGLYVTHLIVLAPILNTKHGFYGQLVHHDVWTELLAKPFAAAAAVLVAAISWHLYEKHFLRLKRFFEYPALRRVGEGDVVESQKT